MVAPKHIAVRNGDGLCCRKRERSGRVRRNARGVRKRGEITGDRHQLSVASHDDADFLAEDLDVADLLPHLHNDRTASSVVNARYVGVAHVSAA
ncbi:MAG: hypothetical protein DMF57_04235 [Acidobacteria bacterium]|nr:MAG: hypothetical protein DMF57_04235 [Acidobacteriota bacterium]